MGVNPHYTDLPYGNWMLIFKKSPSRIPWPFQRTIPFKNLKRRIATLETDYGMMSIQMKRQRLDSCYECNSDQEEEDLTFTGTVTIIPRNKTFGEPAGGFIIMASFAQQLVSGGFFSPRPTISFSAIISRKSEVFRLAGEDDVCGLKQLIEDGKASLRGCESSGWTLLHVFCVHSFFNSKLSGRQIVNAQNLRNG